MDTDTLKVYSSTILRDSDKLEPYQSVEEWINNELLFSNENTAAAIAPLDESFKPQFVSKEVNHRRIELSYYSTYRKYMGIKVSLTESRMVIDRGWVVGRDREVKSMF